MLKRLPIKKTSVHVMRMRVGRGGMGKGGTFILNKKPKQGVREGENVGDG